MRYLLHFFFGVNLILSDVEMQAQSQTGGRSSFQFLNLSVSPRNTALGSYAIANSTMDPSSCIYNPALINDRLDGHISFNQLYYHAGINMGNFSYTHKPIKFGIQVQAGVQYLNTDEIPIADEFGNVNGSTKVNESDFYLAASRVLNERIRVGVSTHLLFSKLGEFTSSGLGFNAGIVYSIPSKKTELAFVIRNAGFAFNAYERIKERLPVTAELGFSKRLSHLPFVMHITAHHLESWNVSYDDPDINAEADLFGNVKEKSPFSKFTGNLFRHLAFGGEMLIGKSEVLALRLGYNHLRRMEVNINDYSLFGGFSFGFGLKIYMFKFDFTHANYHLSGGTNQIGITTQLSAFYKNKKV